MKHVYTLVKKNINPIIWSIVFIGIALAIAGGWYAYIVNLPKY